MSTNLRQLHGLNPQDKVDLCPVATLAGPTSHVRSAYFQNRFADLGLVVERLFAFYEAMRTGKPVANGEEMLTQVRGALSRSTRVRNHT